MNLVLIIAIIILIVSAFAGLGRGLVKSVFSTFALVVAIVWLFRSCPMARVCCGRRPFILISMTVFKAVWMNSCRLLPKGSASRWETIDQMENMPDFIKDLLKSNTMPKCMRRWAFRVFGICIQLYYCSDLNAISLLVCFL